jgi:peptide/nickel transport system substrate-binding protein
MCFNTVSSRELGNFLMIRGRKLMDDMKALHGKLKAGKIGRRGFIQQASAMGLAASIPSTMLVTEAEAATPQKGGHFRQFLRGGSISDTLSPTLGGDTQQQNVSRQLLSNLTELLPNGKATGELAESWDVSANASTWAFKLRKDVEFHNGKTLDAKDVAYSINLHRGEDSTSVAKGLVSGIKDIKVDSSNTVIFTLETGDADFPSTLTDSHFGIIPAGTSDADVDKGIGTGPFKLKHWNPGVSAESERNPNYFKEGLPYFDSVETLNSNDATARQNAIVTGEADTIDDPDLKVLDLLSRKDGIRVLETPGTKHYTFPMRMDLEPYNNPDVRLALKYAVDRESMLASILFGHGYIGNDHPIARSMKYFAGDLPQREYDIDKAKFHLKKAGHQTLDITMHAADIYPGGVDAALLYKDHAAKAGININIERVPSDGYWSEVWNKVPFCASYWSGRPTVNDMFSLAFSNKSTWNETHWNNETFENILLEARAELDETKRAEMYTEMQRLVKDEGGLVAPVFGNFTSVISNKVWVPDTLAPNWVMDGCKNTERWAFMA